MASLSLDWLGVSLEEVHTLGAFGIKVGCCTIIESAKQFESWWLMAVEH